MNRSDVLMLAASLPGQPELVETHSAFVVLTADRAYKLKKDVKFTFLDFSTVELRRQDTDRELHLNQRLAPEVYLGIVPVCRDASGLHLAASDGDCGEVVDHALVMQRLDRSLEMDRVLERGEITPEFLDRLAAKVAAFHAGAVVVTQPAQARAGGYASDFNDILQELEVFRQHLGEQTVARLQALVAISDHFLETHAHHVEERLAAGWVRDVHGDLHSRNIFAYPDPVIFDCLEFNDHFRQIDVLNEVAFLCMDLEAMGFDAFSERFIAAYDRALPALATEQDRNLFLWFKCYRANVRAKVAAIRATQSPDPQPAVADMKTYLGLMERYATVLAAMPPE